MTYTSNVFFVTNQNCRSHSRREQPANTGWRTGWRTGWSGSPVSCTKVPTFLFVDIYELVTLNSHSVGRAYSSEQVEQIDIAATLSVLYAVPIPVNSLGVLIDEALAGLSVSNQLKAAYINAMQILRVARTGLADYAHSKEVVSLVFWWDL